MPKLIINDIQINVFDAGQGSPLLFVHGFPLNHTMWEAQLDTFVKTHRVIAPDLRGFGESGVTNGTVSMEQFADDLNALLDALQITEPICFCGLSMGGYIGWSFVKKYGSRLKSLILCDTRADADSTEAINGRIQMAKTVLEQGPEPVAEAMLGKLFAAATAERRPEVMQKVREMILGTNPAGIAAALSGMAERCDATKLLAEIHVPTLVLVGIEDQIATVSEMRGMAAAIDGSQFAEIPDAGHMAPLENPEAVNAVLKQFFESQTG